MPNVQKVIISSTVEDLREHRNHARDACLMLDFWPKMSNDQRTNIRNKVAETLVEATDLIEKLHYDRRKEMLTALQTGAAQYGVTNEPSGRVILALIRRSQQVLPLEDWLTRTVLQLTEAS